MIKQLIITEDDIVVQRYGNNFLLDNSEEELKVIIQREAASALIRELRLAFERYPLAPTVFDLEEELEELRTKSGA